MDERERRLRALYDLARPRIVTYVLRRASADVAAEIIADVFAVAWRRIDDVPDGNEGVLWLYRTARNILWNENRRLKHRAETIEQLACDLGRAQMHSTDPVDEERLVATAVLARLGKEDREILMLATWEGLNSEQLATTLGCSSVAARLRLHRARARLDRELKFLGAVKQEDEPPHELREASVEEPKREEVVDR